MWLHRHFFITFFMVSLISPILVAGDDISKSKELTNLQQKIKKISQKINDLNSQKNSLQTELKDLEVQYGESNARVKRLQNQVVKLKQILELNREQMQVKQKEIDSQKSELERQVKMAYGMGKKKKLKLMLNQKDPTSSGRMMVYYDYLNKARLKQITKIDQSLQILRSLDEERIKETAVLEKEQENIKQEQSKILKTKSERRLLLSKIKKRFSSKKKQLSQFRINEKKLTNLVSSLQQTIDKSSLDIFPAGAFADLKNKLPWPVKGMIIKSFGKQRSGSKWDGVLIKAKAGDDVRVVSKGLVVYADWLRGYGLLAIIDHGNSYMTLYAFNQSLYKTVGETVEAGSVLASVGQSGGQPAPALYFGIRKKGKPVDPVKWCRKIRRGKIR